MKIIVMGGSFNPPTKAHQQILSAAVEQLQADMGLFVPVPKGYLKTKMKGTEHPQEMICENLRYEMLKAMASGNPRLAVSDIEFTGNKSGRTREIMDNVQKLYPEAELYFLAGADKLEMIAAWRRLEDFMEKYQIAAVARSGEDPRAFIDEHPTLHPYRERIAVIDEPQGLDGISSTAVRDLLRENDPRAEELVHPGVWKILVEKGFVESKAVLVFFNDYYFLSNFYPAEMDYNGLHYLNSESAFHAEKCMTQEEKIPFTTMTPADAKRIGHTVPLRPDWEEIKLDLMLDVVREKFRQHPELAAMLLDTGDKILMEGNNWHDPFWGIDIHTREGYNYLGKILMQVRQELRDKL